MDLTTTPTTAAFTAPALLPGNTVYAPVTITNSGSLGLRYAATATYTGDTTLGAHLQASIATGVSTCDAAGFTSGTILATGRPLSGALFGDPTQGAQAGDRALPAAASDVLCVAVALPASVPNGAAGVSVTGAFTFTAEQTRNN